MDEFKSSGFERAWLSAPPGHRLRPVRYEAYDQVNGLLHAPVTYDYEPISPLPTEMPSDQWIGESLKRFVLGEFGKPPGRGSCPAECIIGSRVEVSHRIAAMYLEACEHVAYSGLVKGVARASGTSMAHQLFTLLSDPVLGNAANSKNIDLLAFTLHLDHLNSEHQRVYFLVPSFPFKDQNPFRTEASGGHVDLGEIALLIRLHTLSLAIYQIHPFGVDWIIVSDGMSYAQLFRMDVTQVRAYNYRLRLFRDILNIFSTVNIIDLRDLCVRAGTGPDGVPAIDTFSGYIAERMRGLVSSQSDLANTFDVLIRGMKWNINYRDAIESYALSREETWQLLNHQPAPDFRRNGNVWTEFHTAATEAAYKYAAINLAIRYCDLFNLFFPNGLRATTHPKAGQVAIPTLGSVMPWNGVAVVRDRIETINSVRTEPLYKICSGSGAITAHCISDSNNVFYYGVEG